MTESKKPSLSDTQVRGIAREVAKEITGKLPVARASRPTVSATAVEVGRTVAKNIGRIVVGFLFMAAGAGIGKVALASEPHNATMLYVGIGVGLLGALIVPSIWDAVQPVVVFIFPNGIPLIGGRRASDPPKAAP